MGLWVWSLPRGHFLEACRPHSTVDTSWPGAAPRTNPSWGRRLGGDLMNGMWVCAQSRARRSGLQELLVKTLLTLVYLLILEFKLI